MAQVLIPLMIEQVRLKALYLDECRNDYYGVFNQAMEERHQGATTSLFVCKRCSTAMTKRQWVHVRHLTDVHSLKETSLTSTAIVVASTVAVASANQVAICKFDELVNHGISSLYNMMMEKTTSK